MHYEYCYELCILLRLPGHIELMCPCDIMIQEKTMLDVVVWGDNSPRVIVGI